MELNELRENRIYKMANADDFDPPEALRYLVENYRNMLGSYMLLVSKHTAQNGTVTLKFADPNDETEPSKRFYIQLITPWFRDKNNTLFITKSQEGGRRRKARRRITKRRKISRKRH